MDNVSSGVTEPCYLLFYSVREFLLILIQQNGARAGGAAMAACVCAHVSVWALSPVPQERAAAQRVRANFAAAQPVSY